MFAESKTSRMMKRPVIVDRIAPTEKYLFTPSAPKGEFHPCGYR
jgi:hypothetical protein